MKEYNYNMSGINVKFVVTKFNLTENDVDEGEKYYFDNISDASKKFFAVLSEHPEYDEKLLSKIKQLFEENIKENTNEELIKFMELVSEAELNRNNRTLTPIGVGYIEKVAILEECDVNIIELCESGVHPSLFNSIISMIRAANCSGFREGCAYRG